MVSKREAAWQSFSDCMMEHIKETEAGHYGDRPIQPLDFLEQWFPPDALAWQVVKYMCRYPRTRNQKDIYKAAHYLSRLWAIHRCPDPSETDT